jgi:hypothetical protein
MGAAYLDVLVLRHFCFMLKTRSRRGFKGMTAIF